MTVQADHHWPVKRLKYAATLRRAPIDISVRIGRTLDSRTSRRVRVDSSEPNGRVSHPTLETKQPKV